MNYLKQSTAYTFRFGPFLDETDGKTAETGLTIAYTNVFLSKAGGAFAAKADTTDLTSTGDSRGYYTCVLNTTDTGTVGPFRVHAHISGALPVWKDFQIVAANVFDSLYASAGTDVLDVSVTQNAGTAITAAAGVQAVNTTQVNGTAQTARDLGASVLLSSGTGTGQVSLSSGLVRLSSTGVDDILDEVVEGTWTFRGMLRLFASVLVGKASGLGTTTAVYRDIDDTKNRVSATVDADGNRTAFGTRDQT
jgi:hypothetical protein